MSQRDTIYQNDDPVSAFVFDDKVAAVFADMINRSVPGYASIIGMISTFAERYVQPSSRCYDLGCSLGAATLAMRHGIAAEDVEIVAVDNSAAMIDRCAVVLQQDGGKVPVQLQCADILQTPIENASMVVLNFTLQFVPVAERQGLIERIAKGLRPGGLLVLSEKIRLVDQGLDELFIDLHHRFKEQNGYSKTEIAKKRAAIENVLVPETLRTHETRLLSAGFTSCAVWFQCFNFASMVAVK